MSKRLDYNHIAPAGVKALGGVYAYVMQSKLPATLINLAYLRVSQLERKGARKRSKLKSEIGRARYRARRV